MDLKVNLSEKCNCLGTIELFTLLMVATGNCHYVVNCFFDVLHRGEYRVVYLTPEYASLDTGFLAQVQNSVGKKKFDKRHHFNVNESQIKD